MTHDPPSPATLLPEVYKELRAIAGRYMKAERRDHTLQPTALVHEAYLRLAAQTDYPWKGRTQFLAVAAMQMRLILVQHARDLAAKKRRRQGRVTLQDDLAVTSATSIDVLALNEALDKLESRGDRQARVAEMRIFSGMTFTEIGEALGVSDRTAKRDWRLSRAWLEQELDAPRRSISAGPD